jgi:ABC-type transporter Mla subunit MlaD
MPENPFQQLRDLLAELNAYLQTLPVEVKDLIRAAGGLVSQLVELIDLIIGLLRQVQEEIRAIDLTAPGLTEASDFAGRVVDLVRATRPFLSADAGQTVDDIVTKAQVLGNLSGNLNTLRDDILGLIDTIVGELESLKPKPQS